MPVCAHLQCVDPLVIVVKVVHQIHRSLFKDSSTDVFLCTSRLQHIKVLVPEPHRLLQGGTRSAP